MTLSSTAPPPPERAILGTLALATIPAGLTTVYLAVALPERISDLALALIIISSLMAGAYWLNSHRTRRHREIMAQHDEILTKLDTIRTAQLQDEVATIEANLVLPTPQPSIPRRILNRVNGNRHK